MTTARLPYNRGVLLFLTLQLLWINNSVKLWDVNRTHDAPSGVLWNYRLYMSAGVSCAQARRREGCAAL